MKTNSLFPLLFFLLSLYNTESYALDRISLGVGKSKESVNICRLGFQREFDSKWLKWKTGCVSGYHEVSLNYWEYNNESIKGAAYSPVFIYEFQLNRNMFPYLEAGIGVSYISGKIIGCRDLSSHFQFEDRVGIGAKIGKQENHDLNLRYMHYSNAGIKQPNQGISIFIFSYTCSF